VHSPAWFCTDGGFAPMVFAGCLFARFPADSEHFVFCGHACPLRREYILNWGIVNTMLKRKVVLGISADNRLLIFI